MYTVLDMIDKANDQSSKTIRVLIPTILIIAWLIIGSFGGQVFSKINNVVNNNQSAFLPKSSQSTKVINIQSQFQNTNNLPAIILFTSHNILNKEDISYESSLINNIKDQKGILDTIKNPIIGPIPSINHKASEIIVPTITRFGNSLGINKLKKATIKHPQNLNTYVTGPAGIVKALSDAFSGINGILTYVAVGAVLIILLIVYRSIFLPFIVLLTAVFALTLAILVVYYLALHNVIQLNGESQGILSILVIGASTDYSIFIVSRFKENLHKMDSSFNSVIMAMKSAFEPILAAASTVTIALLMLLFSELNSNRSLGPVAAIGIISSFLAAMTLLPSLLATFGRKAFLPFKVKADQKDIDEEVFTKSKLWNWVTRLVQNKARIIWIGLTLLLLVLTAIGLPMLKASGVSETQTILSNSQAVKGENIIGNYFPAGSGNPIDIVSPVSVANKVLKSVRSLSPGITSATIFTNLGSLKPAVKNNQVLITATSAYSPDSNKSFNLINQLRSNLPKINANVLVGGNSAVQLDTNNAAKHDLRLIIPLVLIVIFIILMLLLRSIVAPILLILSVMISYAATISISAIVFNNIFHFPGADPSVPLFGFIFLVALGVDYNIFLMTRIYEESKKMSAKKAVLKGLGVTGNVITAAGLVLAVTFAALSVIPILFLVELAFIVALGVILDTIIVRTLIVPSICEDIGKYIWWPNKKLMRHD